MIKIFAAAGFSRGVFKRSAISVLRPVAVFVALVTIMSSASPCQVADQSDVQSSYAMPPGFGLTLSRAYAEAKKREKRHQADLAKDIEEGKKIVAEIEKDPKLKLSKNQKMIERVERIGMELAEVANKNSVVVLWGDSRINPFPYQFRVIEGDDVNAFSIPGGYIYVFEGLLRYVESDDELAGVLAHEIAHASFRHLATLEREQNKFDVVALPLILLAILGGGEGGAGLATAGNLLRTAVGSGWSVKAETAADFGGLQYMLRSKYNPAGILSFIERLAYDERNKPNYDLGIFRTHPPTRERARALNLRLQELSVTVRRSQVSTTLSAQVVPGENSTVDIVFAGVKLASFGGAEAIARADAAAARINAAFDELPKIYDFSIGEGGVLRCKGHDLFILQGEDVASPRVSAEEQAEQALKNLKRAAYELSYRVWDAY